MGSREFGATKNSRLAARGAKNGHAIHPMPFPFSLSVSRPWSRDDVCWTCVHATRYTFRDTRCDHRRAVFIACRACNRSLICQENKPISLSSLVQNIPLSFTFILIHDIQVSLRKHWLACMIWSNEKSLLKILGIFRNLCCIRCVTKMRFFYNIVLHVF